MTSGESLALPPSEDRAGADPKIRPPVISESARRPIRDRSAARRGAQPHRIHQLIMPAPATSGRLTGYRAALRARGIEPDPRPVVRAAPEQGGGYEAGQVLLRRKRRPTAVLRNNDRVAIGFYDAAREHNLTIPTDIAVIGFDNQEIIICARLRTPLAFTDPYR
jgi:DNA-binding LacI/PurR family transcriptional regulator